MKLEVFKFFWGVATFVYFDHDKFMFMKSHANMGIENKHANCTQ